MRCDFQREIYLSKLIFITLRPTQKFMQIFEVALARTITADAHAFAVMTRYALRLSTEDLSLEAPI